MTNIIIPNLDDDIKSRLQKRAEKHGRSLEEEVKEILRIALSENNEHSHSLNLATMIEQRFANLGEFELPEIKREPIFTVSTFEE
ncbi:MAG: plasmid stability protein [Tolypothrix brevis GSE-NOS-MK-07-07A]|jgi:plasmid stability protein|nr:plasmid stability protein [Tolypothrix brevis GSE-NOS-MK-07-07A]